MKRHYNIQAAISLVLMVGGIFFLGYMLHISGSAQTAHDTWLYGALALAPLLTGTAWFGYLYRKMVGRWWHGGRRHSKCSLNKTESTSEEIASRAAMRKGAYRWAFIAFGLVLISVGTMFVLYNNGYIPAGWSHIFISWQMIMLLIGLCQLSEGKGINAAIFFLVGGFFIAPRLATMFPAIYESARAVGFLPVLLIGLGVIVIIAAATHPCRHKSKGCNRNNMKDFDVVREEVVTGDGRIEEHLRFSGMDKVILDPVFNGGHIEVRFAGAVLDLRRTSLPEGVTTLYLNGFMGGINIIAPGNWHIEVQNNNSFGAFLDKRYDVERNPDADRKLVIVANFRFGGGEVASSK